MIATVVSQSRLQPGILDLRVSVADSIEILPGQFMLLYPEDGARLLPRPISVCEVIRMEHSGAADISGEAPGSGSVAEGSYGETPGSGSGAEGSNGEDLGSRSAATRDPGSAKGRQIIRMVYRIAGEGTKEFSNLKPGDVLRMEGPRGNGFPLNPKELNGETPKKPLLIGGGIGLPPLAELSKQLAVRGAKPVAAAGYRDGDLFLAADLARYAEVFPACEELTEQTTEKHREDDGAEAEEAASVNERIRKPRKGNVLEVIRGENLKADVIYACGPMPMLKAVKEFAEERKVPAYVSLEERMACGMGVCLGCVAKTKSINPHSGVRNARVCVEGPVFLSDEVDL